MATKITYNQAFYRSMVLSSIPFKMGSRELDDITATAVLLLSAKYGKIAESFNALISDALKKLKEKDDKYKDFDERAQKFGDMERIEAHLKAYEAWHEGDKDADGKPVERPAKPSDEELKQAEELRNSDDREPFYEAFKALNDAEFNLRKKHGEDEIDEPAGLSSAELQGILRCNSAPRATSPPPSPIPSPAPGCGLAACSWSASPPAFANISCRKRYTRT